MLEERVDHEAKDQEESSDQSFGDILEASLREGSIQQGEIVQGTVVAIDRDTVTVDIGFKSEGAIPLSEFTDASGEVALNVGDDVDVYVESVGDDSGQVRLSHQRARQSSVWRHIEDAFKNGGPVEGTVVGRVKGGLKVDIGVPAFLPGSHVDIRPTRSLERYIGERAQFGIIKCNRARGNVVVSRKLLLEKEREALKDETLKVLEEGIILEGTVKNVTDYGAFVDLGGIDGLLHVTDMAWGRVAHPSKVVKPGDTVKVVVLKFDQESDRISLGMKQLYDDPWLTIAERMFPGSRARGKVVSLTDYGSFVEIEDGVEGLVHVSEMSWTTRVTHPSKIVSVGDEVDVVVLGLDPANRRISLGLKQITPNPWETLPIEHPIGSNVRGKVTSITDFGAFVNVADGIDGLIHISDMHWTRKVKHPSDVLNKGDEVEAVVLNVDVANERLSLGLKQMADDPWQNMPARHPVGSRVHGKVTNVTDFGVFVEIEDGVEGMIHVSQLSRERVEHPRDHFQPGAAVEAEILEIDVRERKIALSVRSLLDSEEKAELQQYMGVARTGSSTSSRTTLGDLINKELEGLAGKADEGIPEKGHE
ncbi:MAG: 30S ribosomal protein S1 [Myxococcales bacterium]|jgi:small subunit ribosomal protein S1|nr:MAG: 30S ribosomal protein S1 [Myxococcales bacterium]